MEAAGEAAGVAGGFGGDGAGVDDDFVGNGRFRHHFMPGGQKLAGHRFDFALVQAAADAVQVNFHGGDFSAGK